MASAREYARERTRDHRGDLPRDWQPAPARLVPIRQHHFHDRPPWPHQHYHDYAPVEGWGWWPRWYPYWDPQWRAYWWQLYDYYGGDGYADYAEYARDAVLRANGVQWGLVVGGGYGYSQANYSYPQPSYGCSQASYGASQVGIEPYGVAAVASRSPQHGQIAAYRGVALESARKIAVATGALLFGYRDSPWGSELSVFGTRAGLQRWSNEQAADISVWYAVTFDLSSSLSPLSEVSR